MKKHIEKRWQEMRSQVELIAEIHGTNPLTEAKWDTMRMCFFAGAYGFWEEIDDHVLLVDTPEAHRRWEAITTELDEWLQTAREGQRRMLVS